MYVCVTVSKMELVPVLWYQVYLENMHLLGEGRGTLIHMKRERRLLFLW